MSQVGKQHSTTPPFAGTADPTPSHGQRLSAEGDEAATARQFRPSDKQLASAFRDLESSVADLKCMAALMSTAAEDTVHRAEDFLGKHLRERSNLQGYKIQVLTEEQDDALNYAIYHLGDLIRALHAKYYAGYAERAAL